MTSVCSDQCCSDFTLLHRFVKLETKEDSAVPSPSPRVAAVASPGSNGNDGTDDGTDDVYNYDNGNDGTNDGTDVVPY